MKHIRIILVIFFLTLVSGTSPLITLVKADSVVVFNEIMYHPPIDTDIEWIELHNQLAIDVDLSNWSLANGVKYDFPEGTFIAADGYLLITDQPAALIEIVDGTVEVHGPYSGNLSNSGESLTLYNNSDRMMDSVTYTDKGDWPVAPDGGGVTLAKKSSGLNSNSSQSWMWSQQRLGTPGDLNFTDDILAPIQHALVVADQSWRYDDSGANNGTAWLQVNYDDTLWPIGQADFYSGQQFTGDTPTSITTLYSSGLNNDGTIAIPGSSDLHYFITSSGLPITVMQNHPAWLANDGSSLWIGLSGQGTDGQPEGDYGFSTTFDLSDWAPDSAIITLYLAVDNEVTDVLLNGISLGISAIGHQSFFGPFTIDSGFISGVNQLDFLFSNWPASDNPMGLRIKMSGTALPILGQTQLNEGPTTHYFRTTFNYSGDPGSTVDLKLSQTIDDGAVYYLNGTEVYRDNMPAGIIMSTTAATLDKPVLQSDPFFSIDASSLLIGENVLAVEVHQSALDDDMFFIGKLDAIEMPLPLIPLAKIKFNEVAGALESEFWLELVNDGDDAINLSQYIVTLVGDTETQYIMPSVTLNPNTFLLIDHTMLGMIPADEDRLFLYTPDKSTILDAAVVKNKHRGRSKQLNGRWQYPDSTTPGTPNGFTFNDDIVINEIMYNHSFEPATEATYQTVLLVSQDHQARTWVPTDDSAGVAWQGGDLAFDDSSWQSGIGTTTGVGYENSVTNDYTPWIGTDVHDEMYGERGSVYARIAFTITNINDINILNLKMRYDDAFIAYINGREVARSQFAPIAPKWNDLAGGPHEAIDYETFSISQHIDVLRAGENILAIHGFNETLTSSDMLLLPELELYQLLSPALPASESDEEWIEIYNKGTETIALDGWDLSNAVSFTFPPDFDIAPDEYVVIANDATLLALQYPAIRIAGEYSGRLSNKSEEIVLTDLVGNIADQVTYFDGKPWPEGTDGFRSSLELADPQADNNNASAWCASDEAQVSQWQTYTYRAQASNSNRGPDGQWHEFKLSMLEAGEILIDDITVTEDPDGAAIALIQNSTFDGGNANTWRLLGNHRHSEVIVDPEDSNNNNVLRIVATGTHGHLHNLVETTLANGRTITNGTTYEITYKAKWISGSNQLNSRLYFNRVAKTTLIEMPILNGSPGAINRCFATNIGPTFTGLQHRPIVPFNSETVTVSVDIEDNDGIIVTLLRWRAEGQNWQNVSMDFTAPHRYSGEIPAYADGTVVQFYVESYDGLGISATMPQAGADSRSLYQVNDNRNNNAMHNFRLIMLADDYDWMHTDIHLMSDDRVGATAISNGNKVFYDIGVRLKSSQRHRLVDAHVGFNIRFPGDNLFGGIHPTIAIDRSEGTTFGQREMLINQVLNRVGGAQLSKYSDLINVIAPRVEHSGGAELQLARFNADFLNGQFDNGTDGQLYEYELIYYPRFTTDGNRESYKIPNNDGVIGTAIQDAGEYKENYRWHYLKKNNRSQDDYTNLINFVQIMGTSGATFNDTIDTVIDVNQWLRMTAIAVLNGAGDNYGGDGSQHNMQMFARPSDNKMLYFMHDLDAFYNPTRPIVSSSDLQKLIATPSNERRYYGHLYDVINTAYNTAYMTRWTNQLGIMLPGQAFASHLSFITQRSGFVLNQLPDTQTPFAITDPNFLVASDVAVVHGVGWIDIDKVYVDGFSEPITLTWTSQGSGVAKTYAWEASLPLNPGPNVFNFYGYDFQGKEIAIDSITVTSTIASRPLKDNLRVTELMYDPIGGSDYEYIEFRNIGALPLDITELKLVSGITFDFGSSAYQLVQPNDYFVLVKNQLAFESRYNTVGMNIAGQYVGKLSNGGETIVMQGQWQSDIISFKYEDTHGWPLTVDGIGHSLVPLLPTATLQSDGALYYSGSWHASDAIHGSPGFVDPVNVTLVINEVMAHTDFDNPAFPLYDSNDWIELYNSSNAPLIIEANHWYLSDDKDNLLQWPIPAMTIAPFSIVSFDEVTDFHNPINQGFGIDKSGETLYLSEMPLGQSGRVVDVVKLAGQPNNISMGRYDGNDWYAMSPSRNAANTTPLSHVMITEVMYHPLPDHKEYIELYNPGTIAQSLWDITTNTGWRLDGEIGYDFKMTDTIAPKSYLVVVGFDPNQENTDVFKSQYNTVPGSIVGPYSHNFSNHTAYINLERPQASDDPLVISDLSWINVDEVHYFDKAPWPSLADGLGSALQRKLNYGHGSNSDFWYGSYPSPGISMSDFNADGITDLLDFSIFSLSWLTQPGDLDWNPILQLQEVPNGTIDLQDLTMFAAKWLDDK